NRAYGGANGAGKIRRIAGGADDEEHLAHRQLTVWQVVLNRRLALESFMFDMPDDADDFAPPGILLFIPISGVDSLADRVLVRPVFARHRLIDNRYQW